MKVSVTQQQLAHGLGLVSRAVSPRSTLAVLANILVVTDEGRLRLSATNLELGISCWIGAQIADEGAITVPARTLSDLVNTLPNDIVHLELNAATQTLNVRCGMSNTDIKGIDAQEFPPMPVADMQDGIQLNAADFKEMIQQVAFAASADEARPVLHGVSMNITGDTAVLAATDGFRISVRQAALSEALVKPFSAIVPARALTELARIASDGDETVSMALPPGRGQVIFRLKDAELISQLIDGNFPDFRAIIPRSFKGTTILTTNVFLKACRQAEIIARESNNVIRLNIQPGGDQPGKVEITAQSEETGSSENFVEATVEGSSIVIAFNVRFLREVLEVIKTPNIILLTNANNTPAMIQPVGEDSFQHVIMPMHLG
ncbi:MAG: DNA polymerase III subunit beta [Anaerolineaceae bacterium]|nr:DNA polymerase III subunit beta [Anaerolineaceae bacterium]